MSAVARGILLAGWMLVGACTSAVVTNADAGESSLRQTLDRHLEAIDARDLDALLATVTAGAELVTILPGGRVLETREQYRQLHVDWFADRSWRMAFDVQDVREVGGVGIARVNYDLATPDEHGVHATRRSAVLVLVFAREDGDWRLVHDQNTLIPPPAAP